MGRQTRKKVLSDRTGIPHDEISDKDLYGDSRRSEDRRLEERIKAYAPLFSMDFTSRRDAALAAPPGWEYVWIRFYENGKIDRKNYSDMRALGFSVVPASRHPDMDYNDVQGVMDKDASDCIIIGTDILMERPKKLGDMARKQDRAEADHAVNSLEAFKNDLNGFGFGARAQSQRKEVNESDLTRTHRPASYEESDFA